MLRAIGRLAVVLVLFVVLLQAASHAAVPHYNAVPAVYGRTAAPASVWSDLKKWIDWLVDPRGPYKPRWINARET